MTFTRAPNGSNATPLVSRYSCRATLVSHFSPFLFAVSHENRATPLKVSQRRPCRTLLGGCRTLSWPCVYHKIVSRYRECRSYSVRRESRYTATLSPGPRKSLLSLTFSRLLILRVSGSIGPLPGHNLNALSVLFLFWGFA